MVQKTILLSRSGNVTAKCCLPKLCVVVWQFNKQKVIYYLSSLFNASGAKVENNKNTSTLNNWL